MKTGWKRVTALFAQARPTDTLVAPGEADCRWRAAAALEGALRVEGKSATLSLPSPTGDPTDPYPK